MSRFLTLLVLIGITLALLSVGEGYGGRGGAALLLGFLLLAAYLAGLASNAVELPRITGFLLLGIAVGPHALGVLPQQAVVDFRLINGGALALIALAAGGELRLAAVRRQLSSIVSILSFQVVIVFAAVVAAVYWGRRFVPFLDGSPPRAALAVGLIFGLVAVAKSPATTIAIITEERAKGVMTETVLGITVVKDVIVLVLIALLIPLAAVIADPSKPFSFATLDAVLLSIAASLAMGIAVGWMLTQYLRRSGANRVLILLFTAFSLVSLSEQLGLEYILIAMTAGFYVQNFSKQGPRFLRALEANSLPIYALFFAVAGADLRVDVLPSVWGIVLLILVLRTVALAASTWLGAVVVGGAASVRRHAWMGFLAQAGVTLGVANIVRDRFPVWGTDVATLIVAMIAVNQLIGPPAFRFALLRAGESRRVRGSLATARLRALGNAGAA
jgi:Kef-type K+ transport system membrane component KefB